jgi:VanZ family protein
MLPVMKQLLGKLENLFSRKIWMLLAIAWSILVFVGCSLPGRELPKVDLLDNVDKIVHFVFFFCLVLCTNFAGYCKTFFAALLLCLLYGFGLEWYQLYFVAGRSFDVWDGVADTLGGMGAWWIVRVGSESKR